MKVAYLSASDTIHSLDSNCRGDRDRKLTQDEARQMNQRYKFKLCPHCGVADIIGTTRESKQA